MEERYSRTEIMFGKDACQKLKESTVCVFGLGGVGGHLTEALVRSGVGNIYICDSDTVSESDLNRQIISTFKTVGMKKTDACEKRLLEISPDVNIVKCDDFFLPETKFYDFSLFDYVADAIDTVSGKVEICKRAFENSVPVISAMGAGNKTDPTKFKVTYVENTKVCPLARVMRHELKKRNIENIKCVYSEEEPFKLLNDKSLSRTPGSNSFVPSVMGLIMAGEIIKDLINL